MRAPKASSRAAAPTTSSARPAGGVPHVLLAALSLPPGVPGEVKGELVACVEALHWRYRQPPQQVQLRICWWGAPAGADAVVPFHASRGAGAAFPVTSGPRFLLRYLRDLGTLSLAIEECPSGRLIGTVSLDTSRVDVTRPLTAHALPCLGAINQQLATADVSLRVSYGELLSSFEMAEHLASADKALPLYPLPAPPPGSSSSGAAPQQQAAAAGTAAAAAVAPAVASAVTPPGTAGQPAAEEARDASSASRLACAASTAAAQQQQQQQQQARPVAAGSAQQPQLVAQGAASVEQQQQQEVQVPAAAAAPAPAPAPAPPAAAASAGDADTAEQQQQQEQACDPLLEVIKKAEQLKQSLDQAAKAGIMLGMPSLQQQQQQAPAFQLPQAQVQQQQQSMLTAGGSLGLSGSGGLLSRGTAGVLQPLLLGPPAAAAASSGGSHSLLTAAELLAALVPVVPAGSTAAAAAASGAFGHGLQPSRGGRHGRRTRPHAAASSAAVAGSSSDDERSSSTHTASSRSSSRSSQSSLLAELDGLEELEDLLLQELLSMRAPHAKPATKHRRTSPHKAKAAAQRQQQQEPAGQLTVAAVEHVLEARTQAAAAAAAQPPVEAGAAAGSLHVELLSLHGLPDVPATLTAVIKCAGQQQSLDSTGLLQQPSTQTGQPPDTHKQQAGTAAGGASRGCGQPSFSATLEHPASSLLQPLLAAQRPCLVLEVWAGPPDGVGQQATPGAAAPASRRLLGIVRVPLHPPQQQQQQQALTAHTAGCSPALPGVGDVVASSDMQQLACGEYPVYDVLQGKAVGTLELSVHLLNPAEPAAGDDAAAAAAAAAGDDAATAAAGDDAAAAAAGDDAATAAAAVAEEAAAAVGVVGVRHVIDVTLVSASGLPDAADLAGAQQPVPAKRFVKYSFPGDEPLYTQEVDCVSHPIIAAHARHTVLLQPGESVADCFAGEGGASEQLLFEVYDKWPDDSDSLAAVGSLPLQQVLSLCQPGPSASAASDAVPTRSAAFLVQLAPVPASSERAAAGATAHAAARPLTLQVSASYSCSPCWALEEPGAAADGAAECVEPAHAALLEQQQLEQALPQQTQGRQVEVADQQRGGSSEPQQLPGEPLEPSPPASPGSGAGYRGAGSSPQYPAVTHNSEAPWDSPGGREVVNVPQALTAAAAAAGSANVAAVEEAAVPCLTVEVCVKVIRACGLQAAVKEAEGWLGNASGLLGRARQLGPHPYITLALFPGSTTVPAVRTPFQAQTFCPQFHYQQVLPLLLDATTLAALASADACVELWHHCPRSQAVAAALSRGLSSSYAMTGQQQVFLGSATLPLQGLLIHPQGIRRWVVLKSQLGAPVGAVQLELCFTHISGTPVDSSPAATPPLLRHPEWLELLPAAAASRLSSYAVLPPPVFSGQWVRLSVHVEELLLPGGDDAALERPRIAAYLASFRLPGSSAEQSTQAKACSSHAATTNLLARSWHVDWRFCSHTWAIADARLAAALLAYPLAVTVLKQEPRRTGASSQQQQQQQGLLVKGKGQADSKGPEGPALVPCGSVEVDLSPLLAKRPGGSAAPSCRWLSGTYPVIHPLSKSLGNTRLRLKVLLELEPQDTPSTAWLQAHPQAHWQPTAPLPAAPAAAATTQAQRLAVDTVPAAAAGVAAVGETGPLQQQAAPDLEAAEALAAPGHPAGPQAVGATTDEAGPQQQQQQQQGSRAVRGLSQPGPEGTSCSLVPGTGANSTGGTGAAPEHPPGTALSSSQSGGRRSVTPRLRAEVSHVSAPPGATSPGSRAAGPASPVPAETPGQLMLLPFPAAAAVGSPPRQPYQQFELGPALRVADGQLKLCDVRVCVESALNLQLPDLGEGWLPALYVRYDWPVGGAVVTTPLVHTTRGSHTVKWFHCLHLPLALQSAPQQQQQQQQTLLPTSEGAATAGGTNPAAVFFQVWCRPVPDAAELPPLYAGLSAVPAGSDALLGCAALDLSVLQLLGAVDGWYNITDVHQQPRGQIKVSLTPLKPLDAPPRLPPGAANGLQQVLAAWPTAAAAASPAALGAPAATSAMLEASLAQLQQQLDRLQHPPEQWQQLQAPLEPEWSESATTAMLQGSLEDSLLQLQHQLQHMEEQQHQDAAASAQQQCWSLGDFGGGAYAGRTLGPPGGSSATASAGAGQELSDAAFMALAAESTAAAESAAAAVEAAARASGQRVPRSDSLLEALKANLEDLDKLSAALAVRIGSGLATGSKGDSCSSLDRVVAPSAAASTGDTAAAAAADRMQSFRHIRTLSDDEEYLVAPVGVTDSEADTDELLGRVDWTLAANSDEDHDVPPGPPPGQAQQQASRVAAASAAARSSGPPGSALQQPLNTEDWMFDIGRGSNSTAAAAAAALSGGASSSSALPGTAGSSSRASSSQVPVHPGQLSPAQAEAAAAASAARLAQVDAAAAAAAARQAAAAAGVTRNSRRGSAADPGGGAAAEAAERPADMWNHLAQVEDEDEAAALQRQQRLRQQREQHLAAVMSQLPSAAARAPQQPAGGQQQQQQLHDPRRLPDALESRLDALLAEFQVSASGPGAFVGRAAAGPLPQFGSYSEQAQAAAAFGRLDGGGDLQAAWHSDDAADSDSSGDFMPVQRVVHVTRGEEAPPAPQQQAGGQAATSSGRAGGSREDPDKGEVLPRVAFANTLPPVQDDFVLEYSDGPPRRWLDAARQQRAQQPQPAAASQQQQQRRRRQQAHAAVGSARGGSSTQQSTGYGSTTAVLASMHAPPAQPQAAAPEAQPPSSGSGVVISTVGRRPVGGAAGGSAGPVDIMEEMFSFSRRPSSATSSAHSAASGSIRHPGM